MVAGVQIYPVNWKILDFGSKVINRLGVLLTRIPWVAKRISPEILSFLAFDAIYCETGFEKELYELMEGVLERKGNYIAMMMMDEKSALYELFKGKKGLGIVHKIMGSFHADIRMRFIHMPEEVKQHFLDNPVYIPTYDNS